MHLLAGPRLLGTSFLNKTLDSLTSSVAGFFFHNRICITLTHSALLGLPVLGADIRNASLQAPTLEKHFIIFGWNLD